MRTKRKESDNDPALFLLHGVSELLGIALNKENADKAWAGRFLAMIAVWIEKYDAKLCEVNEAYRQEKMELGKGFRRDVWFEPGPLYMALLRELWRCWYYRRELINPTAQRYLPNITGKAPKDYLPCLKWPKLSVKLSPKSWAKWERFLWELLKKHNPGLLDELRRNSDRKELVKDEKGNWNTETRLLYWNAFHGQFQKHLRAMVKQWGCNSQP